MSSDTQKATIKAKKTQFHWRPILHKLWFPFSLILKYTLLLIVNIYRYSISPLTPASCRHVPTCSAFTREAIQVHGPLKGTWLGLKRLSKCHPWGTSGYDPVPKKDPKIKVKKLRK